VTTSLQARRSYRRYSVGLNTILLDISLEKISIHIHIIIWIQGNDVNHVTMKIMAYVLSIYVEVQRAFVLFEDET